MLSTLRLSDATDVDVDTKNVHQVQHPPVTSTSNRLSNGGVAGMSGSSR